PGDAGPQRVEAERLRLLGRLRAEVVGEHRPRCTPRCTRSWLIVPDRTEQRVAPARGAGAGWPGTRTPAGRAAREVPLLSGRPARRASRTWVRQAFPLLGADT